MVSFTACSNNESFGVFTSFLIYYFNLFNVI